MCICHVVILTTYVGKPLKWQLYGANGSPNHRRLTQLIMKRAVKYKAIKIKIQRRKRKIT